MAMEERHRRLIRAKYMELTNEIRVDIVNVMKYLYSSSVISFEMEEIIMCEKTSTAKTHKMLDIIPTRGCQAFDILYESCCLAKLWVAADILMPSKAPHTPKLKIPTRPMSVLSEVTDPEDENDPLPEKWPTGEHFEDVKNFRLKTKEVQPKSKMETLFNNPSDNAYKMNHECKGKVLIINNEKFDHLAQRKGTDLDEKGLTHVFDKLGFDCWTESNKKKKEMMEIFTQEKQDGHTKYSCFILIILSHGKRGRVAGTDAKKNMLSRNTEEDNYIQIEEIQKIFASEPSLLGKPKLFFIQACQNDTKIPSQDGADQQTNENNSAQVESAALGVKEKTVGTIIETQESNEDDDVNLNPSSPEDMTDGEQNNHFMTDMFTALATVEGYASYRNVIGGSWFMQALIYVLVNSAHKLELAALMQRVTALVVKARSERQDTQVCETKSTLTKSFNFFPGLPRQS